MDPAFLSITGPWFSWQKLEILRQKDTNALQQEVTGNKNKKYLH